MIDVTLHLSTPLGSPFRTFASIKSGSGILSNVHHDNIPLVVNMDVSKSRACERNFTRGYEDRHWDPLFS